MNDETAQLTRLEEKTASLERRVDDLAVSRDSAAGDRREPAGPTVPTEPAKAPAAAPAAVAPAAPGKGRRIFLMVLGVMVVVGLAFGVPYYLHSRNYETTDDAFIEGHVIQIDPKVAAYVASIHFDDNTQVKKGDLLIELDTRDLDVALQRAHTELAQAQAQVLQAQAGVEQAHAKLAQAQAQVLQQQAQVTQSQAGFDLAGINFSRDTSLFNRDVKAIAKTNLDTTKSNHDVAAATLDAAKANLEAAKANVQAEQSGTDAADAQLTVAKASVETAQVVVRNADLQLSYAKIYAPESGRVTQKAVEPGNYVTIGQAVLSIVPNDCWVTANYKETQLTHMQPGQAVDIEVDAFPGHDLRGRVDSVQRGTGARFSLLPPENATGNYVKVVQRVPVKITFDDPPDRLPPLSPGMSVEPRVDIAGSRDKGK